MAALSYALQVRRGTQRARLAAVLALCLLAGSVSAARRVEAAPSHDVDGVNISMSRGFVYGTAWFKDTGPGRSRIHAWIETYSRATGQLTGSLAHRTGMSSCDSGATCYVLLRTSLQARAGECYVVQALSALGTDVVQARAPTWIPMCG